MYDPILEKVSYIDRNGEHGDRGSEHGVVLEARLDGGGLDGQDCVAVGM
jgi:hypothetical protein